MTKITILLLTILVVCFLSVVNCSEDLGQTREFETAERLIRNLKRHGGHNREETDDDSGKNNMTQSDDDADKHHGAGKNNMTQPDDDGADEKRKEKPMSRRCYKLLSNVTSRIEKNYDSEDWDEVIGNLLDLSEENRAAKKNLEKLLKQLAKIQRCLEYKGKNGAEGDDDTDLVDDEDDDELNVNWEEVVDELKELGSINGAAMLMKRAQMVLKKIERN